MQDFSRSGPPYFDPAGVFALPKPSDLRSSSFASISGLFLRISSNSFSTSALIMRYLGILRYFLGKIEVIPFTLLSKISCVAISLRHKSSSSEAFCGVEESNPGYGILPHGHDPYVLAYGSE